MLTENIGNLIGGMFKERQQLLLELDKKLSDTHGVRRQFGEKVFRIDCKRKHTLTDDCKITINVLQNASHESIPKHAVAVEYQSNQIVCVSSVVGRI